MLDQALIWWWSNFLKKNTNFAGRWIIFYTFTNYIKAQNSTPLKWSLPFLEPFPLILILENSPNPSFFSNPPPPQKQTKKSFHLTPPAPTKFTSVLLYHLWSCSIFSELLVIWLMFILVLLLILTKL